MNVSIVGLTDVELSDEERKFLIQLLHDFVMGVNKLDEPSHEFAWEVIKKLV